MPFWRKRPRWPPSPSVEDEAESLSRELYGLTMLGEKPGVEGVCARGTVDQYPVLLEVPSFVSITQSFPSWEDSGRCGSSDDSAGPPTPPLVAKQDPIFNVAGATDMPEYTLDSVPVSAPMKPGSMTPQNRSREPSRARSTRKPKQSTDPQPPVARQQPSKSKTRKEDRGAAPTTRRAESCTRLSTTLAFRSGSRNPEDTRSESRTKLRTTSESRSGSLNPEDTRAESRTRLRTTPAPRSVSRNSKDTRAESRIRLSTAPASSSSSPSLEDARPTPVQSTVPRRSSSVKHEKPRRPITATRSTTMSGYQSDTATMKDREERLSQKDKSSKKKMLVQKETPIQKEKPTQSPPTAEKPSGGAPNAPSLAERLEEKIRRRKEERNSPKLPDDAQVDRETPANPPPAPVVPTAVVPAPVDNHIERQAEPVDYFSDTGVRPAAVKKSRSLKPALKTYKSSSGSSSDRESPASVIFTDTNTSQTSLSSDEAPPKRPPTRRTVSFLDEPSKPAASTTQQAIEADQQQPLTRQTSSPRERTRSPPTSHPGGFSLLPCSRAVPKAGYQDWYTIKGLTHLNICPGCTTQMRKSRFRDQFTLANPRPRGDKVRCSMSLPWARLAWTQTLKEQLDHLDMLYDVTWTSAGTKPCTGRTISDQYWYRIIDPDTGVFLPKFNVCSACIRNLRTVIPAHRSTFKRSSTKQERVCDLVTDSPRFIRYIDLLDMSATRAEQGELDLSDFMAYARRKVVIRDCPRDRPVFSTWHYMPKLPTFTVCEDCYDDVVWPLVRANQPLARRFSSSSRLLPGKAAAQCCREASCQLYSPRIRAKFQDAVVRDDLEYLSSIAVRRFDAEQRYLERREVLREKERLGYDCDAELRENLEEWKRWE
ncbi:hypothetical protein BDW42DRAFT_131318 [Aspergillus taichungensis]|uniref:Uncharacterized protein n=1 Tax=Aspergillus taichungensis TaxID=482145 RepID=A0A2J5HPR6_9EURO|nr:hypothetical protein BDW42DRAFT_131318 [Aspergillus taichungensis]